MQTKEIGTTFIENTKGKNLDDELKIDLINNLNVGDILPIEEASHLNYEVLNEDHSELGELPKSICELVDELSNYAQIKGKYLGSEANNDEVKYKIEVFAQFFDKENYLDYIEDIEYFEDSKPRNNAKDLNELNDFIRAIYNTEKFKEMKLSKLISMNITVFLSFLFGAWIASLFQNAFFWIFMIPYILVVALPQIIKIIKLKTK